MDVKDGDAKTNTEKNQSHSEAHGEPDHYEVKRDVDPAVNEQPDDETTREEDGIFAQPPPEFTGLKVTKRKTVAAGIPAVMSSVEYALRETGPIRGAKLLLDMNQKDGFDCTSCAWPDPDGERSVAEFCENGAKAVLDEGTRHRVTPEFFKKHSVAELSERSDYWLNHQGRITEPMILREGASHYEPIGWTEAFAKLGAELNALSSPDEAIFYTSGRASNEAAFLYQLFVRDSTVPTTCPTARTCVTNLQGRRSPKRSGSARAR